MKKGGELVSRAKLLLAEQDDEIKQLNEVILNAKCHAIRDAQLNEKEEIQKAMEDEEVIYTYSLTHSLAHLFTCT